MERLCTTAIESERCTAKIACGKFGRYSAIQHFWYNGNKVTLAAESMKGWQSSIFLDEVQGRFDIDVRRPLTGAEKSYLGRKYPHLSETQRVELQERLARFHFSEMVPYYIMRYGFYEGHTDYRADPIAIACIFGFKSIEEIENAFPGKLPGTLVNHYTGQDTAALEAFSGPEHGSHAGGPENNPPGVTAVARPTT